MQEEVERSRKQARFRRAASPGRFVRPAGADVAQGEVALAAGLEVDAGAIGLAAALGLPELPVHRRPRVGILATGDEIVPLGGSTRPGQIFESNGHQLAAACADAGAVPVRLPLADDDPASLRRSLSAARGLDALVCIGGVSVGDRDLVRAGLEGSGARLDFWRVAMRPGKPVAFGRWGKMAVFGLPGNPASSLVTFELFVRPALRALAGLRGSGRMLLRARLAAQEEKPSELTLYLRCRLRRDRDSLWVDGLKTQQSGHLTSVVGLEGLAVLPAGTARLRRGQWVDVILVRAPSG
jgi:molybdopterin molybdotransferase